MKLAKFKLEIKDDYLLFTKLCYDPNTNYNCRLIVVDINNKKIRKGSGWTTCGFQKGLITIQFSNWGQSNDIIVSCGEYRFFNFGSVDENIEYKIFGDKHGTIEDYYKLIITAFKVLSSKAVFKT